MNTDNVHEWSRYITVAHRHVSSVQTFLRQGFWEFIIQGVVVPGVAGSPNLPFFQVTDYGRKVLQVGEYLPHDPTGYLERLRKAVNQPDDTVVAYVAESLRAFQRDVLIAATVMLGVAAERAFLLLCDSLADALVDPAEENKFRGLLKQNSMKGKLDWVLAKFRDVRPRPPLPDNVNV